MELAVAEWLEYCAVQEAETVKQQSPETSGLLQEVRMMHPEVGYIDIYIYISVLVMQKRSK